MRAFVTSIKNSNYTLDGGVTSDKPFGTAKARVSSPIGNFLIAKQIAEDEVSHLLDVTVKEESPFQCEMLLSILASAEFSDECIRLNKTFSILQKVRLAIATKDNIPTSIIENVEFLIPSVFHLIFLFFQMATADQYSPYVSMLVDKLT